MTMKTQWYKSMGCSKSHPKREVHSNTGLSENIRKILTKQPKLSHKKKTRKKEQAKPKVSRRNEIINIGEEINKTEIKKTEKINKTKRWFFEKINKIDKPLARLTKKKRVDPNKQDNK